MTPPVRCDESVDSGDAVAESSLIRLNWGCGSHVAAGWINSDVKEQPSVDLVADIRDGLPLATGSVDCCVSVHALPELPYPQLLPALRELHRTLKPDGALRLVLPDLDRAIAAYLRSEPDYFQVPSEQVASAGGRFIVHCLWYGYSRSLFTLDFTEELLEKAGFDRVCACAYGRTSTPFGSIAALDNRPGESIYVEARKPRAHDTRCHITYNSGVAGDELEIVDVAPDPGQRVKGHFRAVLGEGHRVEIVGWVIGQQTPATEVEVVADGSLAARAPVVLDRPDVAERFADIAEAATAGFRIELVAKGKGESHLDVYAVLKDDGREPLGRIVVRAGRRGLLDVLRRG